MIFWLSPRARAALFSWGLAFCSAVPPPEPYVQLKCVKLLAYVLDPRLDHKWITDIIGRCHRLCVIRTSFEWQNRNRVTVNPWAFQWTLCYLVYRGRSFNVVPRSFRVHNDFYFIVWLFGLLLAYPFLREAYCGYVRVSFSISSKV